MIVEERARHAAGTRSLVAAAAGQPGRLTTVALFAAFVAIWTLVFTLIEAPVAIKHDMSEAYAWGQEFQLGYNQHPPFWAWICGLWFSVFPRTGWAFALLSSLNAGIGLWGAWRLLGDFASGAKRVAAWALLLLTPLYTFYAYKYNANIIFVSIWPWTLHYFVRSVQGRRPSDAIGLGVMAGLAMMSKYYALILLATCFLAAVQHPSRRRYFASASPYVSALVAAAICTPHVVWLLTHDAPPVRYLSAVSGQAWGHVLAQIARTVVGAAEMNLGVIGVVAVAAWMARRRDVIDRPAPPGPDMPRAVLATLALAPFVLTILTPIVLRNPVTPEMTVGIFPLLPLLLIEIAGLRDTNLLRWLALRLALVVTLGALAVSPVFMLTRTYLASGAANVAPYQEIAREATRLWHEKTSRPLATVGGSDWYENAIAFYSPDHPSAFVHFDYATNLWVTPETLARGGLLSVCLASDQVCLAATARFVTPQATHTELSVAHEFLGHVADPERFVVTIIPPRG